jgi:hypothetical protein
VTHALDAAARVQASGAGANFHSALALVLVDHAARAQLATAPKLLAARFGLTATELDQLTTIDQERLEFSAGGIMRARSRALRRLLSITFALFGPTIESAAAAFLAADVPLADNDGDEVARSLGTGRRFIAFFAATGTCRPAAAEIARLELLRAELLLLPGPMIAANQAALSGRLSKSACDEVRPVISDHVRLAAFTVDVLAARPGQDPAELDAPAATYVLLARQAGRTGVQVSRASSAASEVLSRCDGTRTIADIQHETSERLPGHGRAPDEVFDLVKSALDAGFLRLG